MDKDPSRIFPKLAIHGCLSPQILTPKIPIHTIWYQSSKIWSILLQSSSRWCCVAAIWWSNGVVSPWFLAGGVWAAAQSVAAGELQYRVTFPCHRCSAAQCAVEAASRSVVAKKAVLPHCLHLLYSRCLYQAELSWSALHLVCILIASWVILHYIKAPCEVVIEGFNFVVKEAHVHC
jgi:hypothetical protein